MTGHTDLVAVTTVAVDVVRDGYDSIAVDIVVTASAKANFEPSTLNVSMSAMIIGV